MPLLRLFALVPLFALLVLADVAAKDYSVPLVHIEALIRNDGTVEYTEHRTYRFDGSFSEADYRLSRRGFDVVRDIEVREGNVAYELARGGGEGTYRVATGRRTVEVTWRYRAQDEDRTFTISYVLEGAIVKGEEHAELFWTYLSDRWETGTDSLVIDLAFESGHPEEGLHTFLDGRTEGVDIVPTGAGLRIASSGFSSRDRLAVRTIFPASVVAGAPVTDRAYSLDGVLLEERDREVREAEMAEVRAQRAARWSIITVIVAFVSVLTFLGTYMRYSRRPVLESTLPTEVYAPPSERGPAVASALIGYGIISTHHLVATLFDLSIRGYLKLVELEPVKRRLQPVEHGFRIEMLEGEVSRADLRPWETRLLDLVEERARRDERTVKEVFDFQKKPYTSWFTDWQSEVTKDVRSAGWSDPRGKKGIRVNLSSQIPLLGLAVLACVFAGLIGLIALMTTTLAIAFTPAMSVRTKEGEREFRLWKTYAATLRRGSEKEFAPRISPHYPYAVAFGIGTKRLETLVAQGSPDDFFWITTLTGDMISPARLVNSVSTVTTSVNSTMATGMGASAGVAGGGAGGGAR
jgi:uncharacterized membrane protein